MYQFIPRANLAAYVITTHMYVILRTGIDNGGCNELLVSHLPYKCQFPIRYVYIVYMPENHKSLYNIICV